MKIDFYNRNVYTYELKMKSLVEHADALINADKDRKDNRDSV